MGEPRITEIPWETIKGGQLESLVNELIQAMGGMDLDWRKGGSGDGAPDGGRDLEATFMHATPEGDVAQERWWIEVKGRSKSVEPNAVKSAVLNAAAHQEVDVLVVATNSVFTNPTRDWLREWSRTHKNPKVRLWDRATLDRLVRKHPVPSARVIPEIIQGKDRLDLLVAQFEEVGRTPLEADLSYFWEHQEWVTQSADISCLAYAEVVLGDLTHRPWGTLLSKSHPLELVVEALVGLPMANMRTRVLSDEKTSETAAHLLQCALPYAPSEDLASMINNPFEFLEGDNWKELAREVDPYVKHVIKPLWNAARGQLLDACSEDCARIAVSPATTLGIDPRGAHFWRRLNPSLPMPENKSLIIEYREKRCAVGLDLSERPCPLLEGEENEGKVVTSVEVDDVRRVIEFRKRNPTGQYFKFSGD
ncbi:hypothetical protein C9J60_09615 [Streptomyces sp. A244]|uniref:restriction endonuclease n=1 Tax=Streptomyces sp. A244 TaxID=2137016 RepID=UPI000D19D6B9|nr:restriction endonuclease [Streptomyces sp. A244]PTH89055.1 hypothetical protein C9J60_09615 [Streptomyces sp. A244]